MFNITWLKQNMSPGQVLPRSPQSVTWPRLPNPAPQPILSKMDSYALKRNLISIAVVTSLSLSHKCQKGKWGMGATHSSKAGVAYLPKRIQPHPSRLAFSPSSFTPLPQLPVNFSPNSLPGMWPSFLSLYCKAHSPLRLVNNGTRGKISDSYPCGVDGTLSALILSSGMSIIIQEAPPFFPPGCVWYT